MLAPDIAAYSGFLMKHILYLMKLDFLNENNFVRICTPQDTSPIHHSSHLPLY